MFIQDEQFGKIVDYDWLRSELHKMYDHMYPEYNLLAGARRSTEIAQDDANVAISIGASGLAYSIIVAAEEYELAANLKNNIFTLGWTEEHTGSDLLSVRTYATPMSDDPNERNYHVKGGKWLINCSFHADYHVVVAKIDPNSDGPRSLSFFLVPRSSCKNWERLETHILQGMVLTKFDIDGPGILLGKPGHGLSILQRMALPSKYQCAWMGVVMLKKGIPASIAHLATKTIFKEHPLNFSNVFRQMYNLVLKAALYDYIYHRAIVFNTDGFLQFNGTMLKSFVLLRINEIMSQNLLVAGSKGFLKSSEIGAYAMESFVLPVFDGHYTINTLMTEKHAPRYLNATTRVDLEERFQRLQDEMYVETLHGEMDARPQDVRKPAFFDIVDYVNQMGVPLPLDLATMRSTVNTLAAEMVERDLTNDPEHRYKLGDMIHWLESVVAACELWRFTGEDNFLNAIVIQHNEAVNAINAVIAESDFNVPFLPLLRQVPISGDTSDAAGFLLRLHNVQAMFEQKQAAPALAR